MLLTRQQLIDALIAALEPLPHVYAMWEGGSAAFGRVDEYSDLDLIVDAETGQADSVFSTVEHCVEQLSPIARRYVVPLPSWHGHIQRFYQLANASEDLLLDMVVMDHLKPPRFMEVEQHGKAIVYFDKCGATQEEHIDPATWRERITARLTELSEMYPMFQSFVRKEARRGRELDALHFYMGLTLRPLVELLRMRYDPYRYTFGMRYLGFDLPAEILARLQPLCFVADLPAMLKAQREAEAWAMELLADLQQHGVKL
jgi:hypothetical protein